MLPDDAGSAALTGSSGGTARRTPAPLTVTPLPFAPFVGMASIVSDKILALRQTKPGVSRRITYTADRTLPRGQQGHGRCASLLSDIASDGVPRTRRAVVREIGGGAEVEDLPIGARKGLVDPFRAWTGS